MLQHSTGQQAPGWQLLCPQFPQDPRARGIAATNGYGVEGGCWQPRAAGATWGLRTLLATDYTWEAAEVVAALCFLLHWASLHTPT